MKLRMVYVLIAINVALYAMGLTYPLMGPDQLLAYGFSHANWWHLGFNMLALLTFGLGMERRWGEWHFLFFYLGCVVAGGLTQLILGPGVPTIGASGGVFGLMVGYGAVFPRNKVMLLVIPMSARFLAVMYVCAEVLLQISGWQPGVAHWAHLGGAVGAGVLLHFKR